MTTAAHTSSTNMHYLSEVDPVFLTAFLPDKDPMHLDEVLEGDCNMCLVTLLHNSNCNLFVVTGPE